MSQHRETLIGHLKVADQLLDDVHKQLKLAWTELYHLEPGESSPVQGYYSFHATCLVSSAREALKECLEQWEKELGK